MICEKCGSNNPKNSEVCTKCGAKMPTTEICGGFADILSYKGPAAAPVAGSGVDEKTIQKLERKVNVALETSRKLTILTFISLAFCMIMLVCFIVTSCNFSGCSSDEDGATAVPPEQGQIPKWEEVVELPEDVDESIEKIGKDDPSNPGSGGTNPSGLPNSQDTGNN